jgi:hypothetical protein
MHNGRRHGEIKMSLLQACRWARETAADLIFSAHSFSGKKDKPQIMNWKPPPAGFVKANVDVAFNAEKQQGATGVVIRDENSQVIAAKCKWYNSVPDALTAEAFAVRDGAALVNNLHWPKVVLETDSLELQSLWRTRKDNRASILPVLNEIQELTGRCASFDLVHVKRKTNMAAHNLAKFASVSCAACNWLYQTPECILPCIQHDCNADV